MKRYGAGDVLVSITRIQLHCKCRLMQTNCMIMLVIKRPIGDDRTFTVSL